MLDICAQLEQQWVTSATTAKTCTEQRQSLEKALDFMWNCKYTTDDDKIIIYQAVRYDKECKGHE